MKKAATGKRMREMDSISINERGIPGITLMERAGAGLTEAILERLKSCRGEKVIEREFPECVIVCGAGNNGGDGYVAGRLLKNRGIDVKLYSIMDTGKLKGDALTNYKRYIDMGERVYFLDSEGEIKRFRIECRNAEVIVDALFGTGISRNIEGKSAQVIDIINEEKGFVISVDIPSGIGADNGIIYGKAVNADKTITFQMNKLGMCEQPGKSFAGEIEVVDIGIPEDLCEDEKGIVYIAEDIDIAGMIPKRNVMMNKGDAGKVLIVAGSKGMAGAAVLAAKAAYKAGAGLVKVAAVWEVIQVIQNIVPEATCLILSEDVNTNKELISKEAENFDSIVVGPGMGRKAETGELVKHIVENAAIPVILDADGINLVADNPNVLKKANGNIVITPHPGEMGRLLKLSAGEVNRDRLNIAKAFASEYNVVLVLKGAGSVVACPNGRSYINETGNSAIATAGSGDVLSGIIGAFLAAGISPGEGAVSGVYIHGLSGDICKDEIGEHGTVASEIAMFTAEALKRISNKFNN